VGYSWLARHSLGQQVCFAVVSFRTPRAMSESQVSLDPVGRGSTSAEDAELDVLIVGGVCHVGAGQQDVAAVDDYGLRVELGVRRLALVCGPLVSAVLRVGACASSTVEVFGGFKV